MKFFKNFHIPKNPTSVRFPDRSFTLVVQSVEMIKEFEILEVVNSFGNSPDFY